MKLITFVLLLSSSVLAADPPKPAPERFPVPEAYMTLFNGLLQNIQNVQKQVQLAEEKLRTDLCKEKNIPVSDCEVNWQSGAYGKRAPSAAPVPPASAGPKEITPAPGKN